jgi:Amt family ammonium transporter
MSVHGAAGVWGTLANGLFATDELAKKVNVGQGGLFDTGSWHQFGVQLESVVVCGLYVLIVSFIILGVMKLVMGLRVTEEQEIVGLDLSEHGTYGYPEQMKKAQNNN